MLFDVGVQSLHLTGLEWTMGLALESRAYRISSLVTYLYYAIWHETR